MACDAVWIVRILFAIIRVSRLSFDFSTGLKVRGAFAERTVFAQPMVDAHCEYMSVVIPKFKLSSEYFK